MSHLRDRALRLTRRLPSARFFGLLWAIWASDAALRALQLGRPAPFGNAFVEKFEWYFFHALAFDARYHLLPLLPLLGIELVASDQGRRARMLRFIAYWATLAVQLPLRALTVLDQEVMRYLGIHASPAFLLTYSTGDAASDLGILTGNDRGGAHLSLLLALGAPLITGALALGLSAWFRRRQAERVLTLASAAYLLAGWFLTTAWGGGFRELKLRPAVAVWIDAFTTTERPILAQDHYEEARDDFRRLWLEAKARPWVFPDARYPFWRATEEEACARGWVQIRACDEDRDGDGVPARADCDDTDGSTHQGAFDTPSNGTDEDCDGSDALPFNVVLLILESHRALDVGHLGPFGAAGQSTPALDRLAAEGSYWTRHQTNGIPTIAAFMNLHCSIHEIPGAHIATSYTGTRLDCLPSVLRRHGYQTRFFTAAAPDWDNQTHWVVRWYDDYDFSRDRQTDLAMFRHMGRWMLDHLSTERPFFVAAITKTNHYPFNGVADMTPTEQAAAPSIAATMRYTDRALEEFLNLIANAPWRARTLVVVTGDHGTSLGEHGTWGLSPPLHRPVVWVPLVLAGEHPMLRGLKGAQTTVSSHVDVMPTILDLVGIHDATASVGQSLVHAAEGRHAFINAGNDMVLERGTLRLLLPAPGSERPGGIEAFDVFRDPAEMQPLNAPADLAEWQRQASSLQVLTRHALHSDSVVPRPLPDDAAR